MIDIMSVTLNDLFRLLPFTERQFGAGEYLFHQGDEVRFLYRILMGSAQLIRHQMHGSTLILQRADAGAVLAEASMFSDRYHCDAVAAAPVCALVIGKAAMRGALAQNSGLAEAWAAHLAHEVQRARFRAEMLSLRTVKERLDAWIDLNERFPPKGEWKTVATEIGVSPEALYRELAKRRQR